MICEESRMHAHVCLLVAYTQCCVFFFREQQKLPEDSFDLQFKLVVMFVDVCGELVRFLQPRVNGYFGCRSLT